MDVALKTYDGQTSQLDNIKLLLKNKVFPTLYSINTITDSKCVKLLTFAKQHKFYASAKNACAKRLVFVQM